MLVLYTDDILQTGPVKKEVAHAVDILVKCYSIEGKSDEDPGT